MILRILAWVLPPSFGGIYSKLEASWLDLSKITLPFRGIQKQEKLKLLHISDLHLSKTVSIEEIQLALPNLRTPALSLVTFSLTSQANQN
jgi:predicted MPP superfamily phosphohydrolase